MSIASTIAGLLKKNDLEFVQGLYREILLREADPDGLHHHTQLLQAGVPRMHLLAMLIHGSEAQERLRNILPHPQKLRTMKEWYEETIAAKREEEEILSYEPLRREKPYCRKDPVTLGEPIHWKFEFYRRFGPPPQFIARLPRGRVLGVTGTVLTEDNTLITDLSIEYREPSIEKHTIFYKPVPRYRQMPGVAAVVACYAAFNYYHWMIEVASRFFLLERAGLPIDWYIVNPFLKPFQRETLALLGIPASKLIELSVDTHLEFERLVVPSFGGYTGVPPRWTHRYLRERMASSVPEDTESYRGYERIYVSRAVSSHRRVLNHDQVVPMLERYGIREVRLENYTVAQQIGLFRNAELIVGPHGAGLANVIFCRQGAKLIEWLSPRYVNPMYWKMADYQQMDYYYSIGQGERPANGVDPFDVAADIFVDIGQLEGLIQKALLD